MGPAKCTSHARHSGVILGVSLGGVRIWRKCPEMTDWVSDMVTWDEIDHLSLLGEFQNLSMA